jgi:uncharacterized RDD family membrane protein YckC
MEPLPAETATDLSAELESLAAQFSPASKIQRFVNFLIDTVVIYALAIIEQAVSIKLNDAEELPPVWGTYMLLFSIGFLYYSIMEGFCGGKTLGKLCTRTKVVDFDTEQPIGITKAMGRALCRYIPFEVLSGFATPWHDSWTQTTVVKINV